MKALFFLYEGYVDWEISTLSYILNVTGVENITTALTDEVTHVGGFNVKIDLNIDACKPCDYDILIIPGGEPIPFDKEVRLLKLIQKFHKENKSIAAICGGTVLLAAAGVLHGKSYSTSVDDSKYNHYFK